MIPRLLLSNLTVKPFLLQEMGNIPILAGACGYKDYGSTINGGEVSGVASSSRMALVVEHVIRNGMPRQSLVVPLARAQLMFDTARVPPTCLEGLEEYSHGWIIYVFHLNTDLDKLWKHLSRSKLKAKTGYEEKEIR